MDLNIADFCAIVRFFFKKYVLYFILNRTFKIIKGFSFNENLNVAIKDKISILKTTTNEGAEMDIGEKMKQRAIKNYGVQDFLLNIPLLTSDKSDNDVKYLWQWFDCKIFDNLFSTF